MAGKCSTLLRAPSVPTAGQFFSNPVKNQAFTRSSLLLRTLVASVLFLLSTALASSSQLDWQYANYRTDLHQGIYFYCAQPSFPGYFECWQIEPLSVLYD